MSTDAELIARLEGYNGPYRAVDDMRQMMRDIYQAAARLRELTATPRVTEEIFYLCDCDLEGGDRKSVV